MEVTELKQKLAVYPDSMEVFLDERHTEFKYGLLNGVSRKKITFSEDVGEEPISEDTVLILSEQ